MVMKQRHQYTMGIVGNCSYMTHINTRGDISWMCWPRFDSSFIFGSLLDDQQGGEFSIRPEDIKSTQQYYLENTNILCTEVTSAEGKFRITDFAPRFRLFERYFKPLMLIRKIEPLESHPRIRIRCNPVTGYGKKALKAIPGSNHVDYYGSDQSLRLTSNCSINLILENRYFVLNETKYLVLTYGSPLEAPLQYTCEEFLQKTMFYWRNWVINTSIGDMYQKQVIRSALTLKLHQYEDTGAIIASATTSLPESPGSGRTWDYRYCWLRDAYYILQAFNNIGHFEEMEHYFHFIANVSGNEPGRFQPLYGITGERDLRERELPLKGYLGNQPVRIGNQASEHIQNDVYGQVLMSLLPLYTDARFSFQDRKELIGWTTQLLERIEQVIDEEDAGLWEFRDMAFKHCYTNLFHWAGGHAARKIAVHVGQDKLIVRAQELVARAAANIEACYDPDRQVYTHAVGSPHLDASTLQLIMMGYLAPSSERARAHLRLVEKELSAPKGLFYRYTHEDDFGKPKATFLITAFWYVEALACVGRIAEAMEKFESLLGFSNHLGLFSEDVSPGDGSQWGNFPQAYSHVGLMNAAYRIAKRVDRPAFL